MPTRENVDSPAGFRSIGVSPRPIRENRTTVTHRTAPFWCVRLPSRIAREPSYHLTST
jgi:hypothetical protein